MPGNPGALRVSLRVSEQRSPSPGTNGEIPAAEMYAEDGHTGIELLLLNHCSWNCCPLGKIASSHHIESGDTV